MTRVANATVTDGTVTTAATISKYNKPQKQ